MALATADLTPFRRGDTHAVQLNFERNIGTEETPELQSVNMAGWGLTCTLKYHSALPDNEAAAQVSNVIDMEQPVILFRPEDTAGLIPRTYFYDVQLVSPDKDVVLTLVQGEVELLSDITQSV